VDRVKKELASIRGFSARRHDLDIAFDQSSFIKRSIHEVQGHLVIGGFFAVHAVLLFLKACASP
jgi:HAE1 family hydrophobic/amphiphilic exporter-1